MPAPTVQHCYRHPDREAGRFCTRCGRPACPECLTPASVGFHCRACVAEARGTAMQRAPRTVAGARIGQKPIVTMVLIGINLAFFLGTAVQARSAMNLLETEGKGFELITLRALPVEPTETPAAEGEA